ncbi:DUF86 domain-containing protein [Thermosynechococcaceae cyanobacterium BACA0444]|uniref:DUF86 domain-containing protein n=1 Tax=Pseudocalidococcus azoricus BACA0444 TaxID=2918990 RepID=A0AAE4FQM1_9CYAN|nr:HepT-like ribonuclease domain-containing protein [Pseudocalidococcus azoricus]MDS3860479.1 DUF86 domain-containing protein [Pseudocalidococcus azoricus BACA0444]
MLPREFNYLEDMLEAATLAQGFIEGIDWETFEQDLMCQATVMHQFTIIGEATRRISPETQATISKIFWRQIIGMRNRLTYEYDDLDIQVIWDTVQIALPGLVNTLGPNLCLDLILWRGKIGC